MKQYRLGRSIAQIVPFYRQKDEPIVSNKILYIFGIVAIAKIAFLILIM